MCGNHEWEIGIEKQIVNLQNRIEILEDPPKSKEEVDNSSISNTTKATIALCIDKFQELAGKNVEAQFSVSEIIDVLEEIAQQ